MIFCRFLFALMLLLPLRARASLPVSDSYADVVERLLPSVVSVSATKVTGPVPLEMLRVPPGSPFEDFFREFYKNGGLNAQKAILLGSGFVYSADGYIVTSSHVVENMDEVMVTMNGGKALKGKVVGKDPKTDIALVKVDSPEPLTPVTLSDSDQARVGDVVLAIGNPFGLGNTVTSGIISARSRDIQVGPYDDFLQTDAAINRGNSGGPLFNAKGGLVGVNTAIFSPSGGSVGIAFAVPSNMAKWVADSLIKDGRIRRGRLGLKIQTVSPEIAQTLKMPKAYGALVAGVDPKSPASTSGIKAGDVIVSFDGTEISSMRQLPRLAAESPVGGTVTLGVWRDGKVFKAPLVIDEMKEPVRSAPNAQVVSDADKTTVEEIEFLGVSVADLSPAVRQKFRLSKSAEGVLITKVVPKTDAALKGLRAGDLIVEIDKKPAFTTKSVADWKNEAAETGQDSAFLLIERNGERFFMVVKFSMPE
ncbi:trypsin-like serine protease [Acetobacter sp. CAG:977]|nr:trypsin-like serine protease [Acetobacter sp. CAG:977]